LSIEKYTAATYISQGGKKRPYQSMVYRMVETLCVRRKSYTFTENTKTLSAECF